MKLISIGFSVKLSEDDSAAFSLAEVQQTIEKIDCLVETPVVLEYIEFDAAARTINVGMIEAK